MSSIFMSFSDDVYENLFAVFTMSLGITMMTTSVFSSFLSFNSYSRMSSHDSIAVWSQNRFCSKRSQNGERIIRSCRSELITCSSSRTCGRLVFGLRPSAAGNYVHSWQNFGQFCVTPSGRKRFPNGTNNSNRQRTRKQEQVFCLVLFYREFRLIIYSFYDTTRPTSHQHDVE